MSKKPKSATCVKCGLTVSTDEICRIQPNRSYCYHNFTAEPTPTDTQTEGEKFNKNLIEVISFAKTKNMQISWMFTPDMPTESEDKFQAPKLEKIFGVNCYNHPIMKPADKTDEEESEKCDDDCPIF